MSINFKSVALTGHTKGIGRSLYNLYTALGVEVIGFSRSNHYDISDPKPIIEQAVDADVFINNAYHPTGQYELLEGMIERWQGTNKLIINISSKGALLPANIRDTYCQAKFRQNELIKSRILKSSPRILNVVVGLVDTDLSRHWNFDKINTTELAKLIYDLSISPIAVQEVVLDVPGFDWDAYNI